MDRVFTDILAAFAGKRIMIVGDIMLDEYVWGEVRRISPEAPVPVVDLRRRTYVPGGAANAAANVMSLGGRALLGGVLGRDHHGAQLAEELVRRGLEVDGLVIDTERPTTTKTRIIAHNQQMVRLDSERRIPLSTPVEDQLLLWIESHLPNSDACIISDYGKGIVSARLAERLIALARRGGKPTIVDPKGPDCAKYKGATLLKPNHQEAERLCKQEFDTEKSLMEATRQLLDDMDGTALLITRGSEGMSLIRKGLPPVHIPSVARDVFDVTGAGDTVAGALALALAAGATLDQAASIANRAAGIVVGKIGTATLTREELSTETA